jgi:hypothetical protein
MYVGAMDGLSLLFLRSFKLLDLEVTIGSLSSSKSLGTSWAADSSPTREMPRAYKSSSGISPIRQLTTSTWGRNISSALAYFDEHGGKKLWWKVHELEKPIAGKEFVPRKPKM